MLSFVRLIWNLSNPSFFSFVDDYINPFGKYGAVGTVKTVLGAVERGVRGVRDMFKGPEFPEQQRPGAPLQPTTPAEPFGASSSRRLPASSRRNTVLGANPAFSRRTILSRISRS